MTRTKKVRIANPAKLKKLKNSALLVSLSKAAAGAANPNKKRRTMKKKNSHSKRSKNPAVGAAPKKKSARKNPIVLVNKRRAKKRNPLLFGRQMNTLETVKLFGGGLVGVTVTKLVPAYLPIPELNSNPTMRVLVSGATAFLAGYFASKMNPDFGSAVMFGGGMQTLSVALNAFLPGVGSQIGLRGVRRGVGQVVTLPQPALAPENPFRQPRLAAPTVVKPNLSGAAVYASQY